VHQEPRDEQTSGDLPERFLHPDQVTEIPRRGQRIENDGDVEKKDIHGIAAPDYGEVHGTG
jgi:hypothetical protein